MALEEVGARLTLRDRVRFGRDARGAARDVDAIGKAADKADRELAQTERQAKRTGRSLVNDLGRGAASGAKGLGKLAKFTGGVVKGGLLGIAAGVGVLAVGAVTAGRSILNLSAQLEATGNKAKTVFGTEFGRFTKWSDKNAAKMGLTTNELVGLGAGFADLLIPMGFTRKRASQLTQTTIGLSGALSQWSGGTRSAAEVSDILAAAMLGETDSLKGLGIGLSAAEIEARLLAKGQSKLTGAALEQAKAQATLDLILAKSTDAQAAYAKGGNRLLTAQARLSAAWKTGREELSKRVAPHAANMLERLVKNLPRLQKAAKDFVGSAWPPVREGLRSFGQSMGNIGKKFSGVTSKEGKAKSMGQTFGTLIGKLIEFSGKAAELWVTLQIGIARFVANVSEKVGSVLGFLASVYEKLRKLPGPLGREFRETAKNLREAEAGAKKFAQTLDDLTRPRTVTVTPLFRTASPPSNWGPLASGYVPAPTPKKREAKAAGGRYSAFRPFLAGERGPELVVPQSSGFVLTARRTAATLAGAAPLDPALSDANLPDAPAEPLVVQVMLDGKVLAEAVVDNVRDRKARR